MWVAGITYDKGASVLRMLAGWLGQDSFFSGLQNYIRRFKYNNAAMADLWQELSAVTGSTALFLLPDVFFSVPFAI